MRTIKKLLYTSLVDVSVPYGPGVNERGFIKDMARRFGENFKAVIPRPSRGVPNDLRRVNIDCLNYSKSSRTPLGWIESRLTGCYYLQSIIAEFQPDFIVVRPGALLLPQFFAIGRQHIPYALKTAGGGTFEAFYRQRPLKRLRRLFQGLNEYFFSELLNKCAVVDVASDIDLKSLTDLYPQVSDRAFMVDNGVDLEMFASGDGGAIRRKLNISEEEIVIGYVGAFPLKRGGKEVVDLVNRLHGSMPVKGIIVGDSGEADQCRHYARESGLSHLITVTGQVEFEDVPDLMKAMDIGLSILRAEEQNASEQKVRQYLASELCVIGTKGSNDFLKGHDFARVVSEVDASEIYDAACSLLKEGRSGLNKRAIQARQFALNGLSIESRNDYRLRRWSDILVDPQ